MTQELKGFHASRYSKIQFGLIPGFHLGLNHNSLCSLPQSAQAAYAVPNRYIDIER